MSAARPPEGDRTEVRSTELSAFDPRDFIAEEAALLDARRFDDWLALFAEDGRYWVPLLGAAQADPFSHNSIAYEDRLLLQLRVDRLKNPRAHTRSTRRAIASTCCSVPWSSARMRRPARPCCARPSSTWSRAARTR